MAKLNADDFKSDDFNWKVVCAFYMLRLLDRWIKVVEAKENSRGSTTNKVRQLVGLPRNFKDLSERDKYPYHEMKSFMAKFFNEHLLK